MNLCKKIANAHSRWFERRKISAEIRDYGKPISEMNHEERMAAINRNLTIAKRYMDETSRLIPWLIGLIAVYAVLKIWNIYHGIF